MGLKIGKGIPKELAIAIGLIVVMLLFIGYPSICSTIESIIGHVGFCSFWNFLHNVFGGHSPVR